MPVSQLSTGARFARCERGAIAVVFALVLVPLLTIVSLAIDYGRALSVNAQLTSAADAATAAVLHKLPATVEDLKPFVRRQLDANLPDHLKELPFELTISELKRRVQLSMQTEIPTALIAIAGIKQLEIGIVSTQVIPKAPQIPTGLAGLNGKVPTNQREAERALRALVGRGANGASAPAHAPSPEDIKKLEDEINRQVQEALAQAGHGNVDFGAIKDALRR